MNPSTEISGVAAEDGLLKLARREIFGASTHEVYGIINRPETAVGLTINKRKLKALCQKHRLKLLILHGSYVSGHIKTESDIDVAILAQNKLGQEEYLSMLADFSDFFGDKFDPVFLNGAEPMISYRVAIGGRRIYEEDRGVFEDFRVQSMAKYMDTRKFRELEKRYIKRALGKE